MHEGHRVKCKYCGKLLSRAYVLKRHILDVHEDRQKDHKCVSHINAVHDGRKDYKCKNCGKLFSYSGNLKKPTSFQFMKVVDFHVIYVLYRNF